MLIDVLGVPLSDMSALGSSEKVSPCQPHSQTVTPKATTRLKHEDALHSPIQITFVRSRMMYARCALNAKGEVQFGLRHIREFVAGLS